MTNPWAEIAASRRAAGELWSAQTNLDFMGRDYSHFETNFDVWWPTLTDTWTAGLTAKQFNETTVNVFTVWFPWPQGWSEDLTFSRFVWTVELTFEMTLTAGNAATCRLDVEVDSGSLASNGLVILENEPTGALTTSFASYTVSVSVQGFPSTALHVGVSFLGNMPTPNVFDRTWQTRRTQYSGPNCRMLIDYA